MPIEPLADGTHQKGGELGCELVSITKDPDSMVIKGALD